MPEQVFTGETLAEALKSGALDQPSTVLVGMVKPSGSDDHVAFALRGCDEWVDLPTQIIERAEHLGSRRCDDHSHPVFRVTLKESDDPQAKLLGSLSGSRSAIQRTSPLPRPPRGPVGLPDRRRTAASVHSGGPFAAL